ncbi:MAG: hypothetical protein K2X72_05685 [Reyranella sp.]|nr:hypothetical protein [Reyranella sp.]
MKHERGIDGAVAGARPGAEIMPAENAGMRSVGARQEVVVLGDDGAVAVADVQFRHGSAHALLHHFLAGQDLGQSLPDALRQRKMQLLAQRDPVQVVRQAEHVLTGLVALWLVAVDEAWRRSAVHHQAELPAEIVGILHAGVHALAADVGADMGGIADQEDAADLVALRLTAMDPVADVPDRIAQHAARSPGIEQRLEGLQGRCRRRMIALGRAEIGHDGGAPSRQRKEGEHALGSEERHLFIFGQLPVDLDIRRDEIGGIGVAGERDAERVANRAVRAVAADEVGGVDGFLAVVARPKRRAHAAAALFERDELDAAFRLRAETRQIGGQQALRLALRQLQDEGKGRV